MKKIWILLLLCLLNSVAEAQDVSGIKPERSTPQRTLKSFVFFLQERPGQFDPAVAAECLDFSHLENAEQRIKLTLQLKRWLDAKGLSSYQAVPDRPDYVDSNKESRYSISSREEFKKIYLSKTAEGLWLFSAETVGAIAELYHSEFPPLYDFALNHLPKIFHTDIPVLGIKLWQVAGLFFLVIVALLTGRLASWILDHLIRKMVSKTDTVWDDIILDAISKPIGFLVVCLFISRTFPLLLFASLNNAAAVVFGTLATICLIWAAWRTSEAITEEMKKRAEQTDSLADDHIVFMSKIGLRIVVIAFGIILILQSLGVEVATLIAGLGIGGLAVALAMQSILGDLFASLVIALDKPFILGDEIQVGNHQGTVEYLGLKTTRIKSVSGEQVIMSNSDLLKGPIRNFKRMQERREVFAFGVVYQTPSEKLEVIPKMVQEIIESTPKTRFERVHFKKFGDSSLDYEAVFWMLSPKYKDYLDAQQAINLAILRRFEKEKIEFAYPTRTLLVEKIPT